jgi:hypothetical protein
LTLKVLSANFAGECDLGTFVGALVYHQIIRFGEATLAKFANKFTLWSHFTTEIGPTVVIIDSHYRKHFGRFWICFLLFATRDCPSLSLSHSLVRSSKALNLFPKCVLNGLLTWCSCNPRFFCMEMFVAQRKKKSKT